MYDLVIIGGGPAGVAAGVYAARKRIKTLYLTDSFGGQSLLSPNIQNWIGIVSMTGMEMAEKIEQHLKTYAEDVVEIKTGERVSKIEKINKTFKVIIEKGENFETKAVILASGSRRRRLNVPGDKELNGRGMVYCATCDAPLFRGKEVAVVGGGNAAFETALQLTFYATKIYILVRGSQFKGDPVIQEKVLSNPKVTSLTNVQVEEVKGQEYVTGLAYGDLKTGEQQEIAVEGIFVEIGSVPNSDMVKGLCKINGQGEVIIDHKNARTSVEGIWAAGDVTDQLYKQNNISMGYAVIALEDVYLWLQNWKEEINKNAINKLSLRETKSP